jgi:hypothetical protein
LQFTCERESYSDEVSEADAERCSITSQFDKEVISIGPDILAEIKIHQ